jgi:hypothetical protein
MKIYLASPGIDTGVFSFPYDGYWNLLFSYYDLSELAAGITSMRKESFQKIIKEGSHEHN